MIAFILIILILIGTCIFFASEAGQLCLYGMLYLILAGIGALFTPPGLIFLAIFFRFI